MPGAGLPYWRLSAFYLCFFGVVGGLTPYWGPYLKGEGFNAAEIGQLIAILHGTKIIAPNVWGWIADRSGRRMRIVRLGALAALLSFSGVLLSSSFWWLALVMMVFSFFWHAALPQFEANTMNHLGGKGAEYSRIRLWGSVGFIITVLLFGELIAHYGVGVLPWLVLVMFAGLWIATMAAPESVQHSRNNTQQPILQVMLRPEVLGFFAACFLLQASHGPFYAFFSIYLDELGYRSSTIGLLWAMGVVAEIGLFLVMHRLLPRFGPHKLLLAALALAAVRWTLIGAMPQVLPALVVAQSLHAASFGIYHAVGIHFVNHFFTGSHQGRGQALYSSITFGAGVAVGSLVAGLLWDTVGGAVTFYIGAGVAGVAFVIALLAFYGMEGIWRPRSRKIQGSQRDPFNPL